MSFSFQSLSEPIAKAVTELGYKEPTEIQSSAIPLLLERDTDFVGQAQTGTGKTAAFCLPLLEKVDFSKKGIQALILSPTRELANQINQEIINFSKYMKVKTATVYGGVGYREQINNIERASIVIATPGRAIDLLDRGKLKIQDVQVLIIDEADEMLNMGFLEDVEHIMDHISENSNKWMFSATMPSQIVRLMESKLNEPEIVRLKKKTLSNTNVTQSYCCLPRRDFVKALRVLLINEPEFYGIIFCETREETRQVTEKLLEQGRNVVALHGDLNQNQRDHAMDKFKSRRADILVCTDVAARGIDVTEVTHVINMGLPRQSENYVHRIGRTGRAGNLGNAISFVSPNDSRSLKNIERIINQKLEEFKIPSSSETKRQQLERELAKMDRMKSILLEEDRDFSIDEKFEQFEEYFQDLSKEDALKLLFAFLFNKEFRLIDEMLQNFKSAKMDRMSHSGGRGGRNSRGGRGGSRGGSGRGGARRSDSRRGEGRRSDSRRGESRPGRDSSRKSRSSDSRRSSEGGGRQRRRR